MNLLGSVEVSLMVNDLGFLAEATNVVFVLMLLGTTLIRFSCPLFSRLITGMS